MADQSCPHVGNSEDPIAWFRFQATWGDVKSAGTVYLFWDCASGSENASLGQMNGSTYGQTNRHSFFYYRYWDIHGDTDRTSIVSGKKQVRNFCSIGSCPSVSPPNNWILLPGLCSSLTIFPMMFASTNVSSFFGRNPKHLSLIKARTWPRSVI